jgi:major membrane immunogen (membrane-anchored lipoprotein)
MKCAIITGVMATSILLAGCGKKNGSSDSSATLPKTQADAASPSPVTQPALAAPEAPQPPSDAELRQKVTGVWKYSNTNKLFGTTTENTFTFAPNGNYAKQAVTIHKTERNNFTGLGTWQIKAGVLITTITKADPIPNDAVGGDLRKALANGGFVNQHKIISVNDHELVCDVDVYTITGIGGHSKTKGTMKWSR